MEDMCMYFGVGMKRIAGSRYHARRQAQRVTSQLAVEDIFIW